MKRAEFFAIHCQLHWERLVAKHGRVKFADLPGVLAWLRRDARADWAKNRVHYVDRTRAEVEAELRGKL